MTNPTTFDGTQHRPMTDEEFAQWQADSATAQAEAEAEAATLAYRASALAKLKALGLTDAEVAALVGR